MLFMWKETLVMVHALALLLRVRMKLKILPRIKRIRRRLEKTVGSALYARKGIHMSGSGISRNGHQIDSSNVKNSRT